MGLKNVTGYFPDAVVAKHRRGPEFVRAMEAGDEAKAQAVLARILKDKDGQTAWVLVQGYCEPAALAELKARVAAARP